MTRPDIYIGLVGAAGTDLEPVKNQIKAQFAAIGYSYEEIKVSRLIASFSELPQKRVPEDDRIRYLMDVGDKIREAAECGDGVISLVMDEIRKLRSTDIPTDQATNGFRGKTIFLIDSLKNPAEITALDSAYARNYYTISVYTAEHIRLERLACIIAGTKSQAVSNLHREEARKILKEDEGRKPVKLAQDVLGTFPRADFFVRSDANISSNIKRFVELIFGNPFITPTQDETFMNLARTASLRSCDLSRQVGAVIVDERGAVISQGCNEVPYPGGGFFYEGREDASDNRDHVTRRDPNQAEILDIVKDFIKSLRESSLINSPTDDTGIAFDDEQFAYELMQGKWSASTSDLRIRNLIEFGRVVHAEMHAICEAARLGRKIEGTTLYCTTFPCHGCTRHIIAAGVRQVVFIEPYPKSLTKILYENEISTDDPKTSLRHAVVFRPFEGVSPILFRRVFAFKTRKNNDGSSVSWNGTSAIPLRSVSKVLHYEREVALIERNQAIRYKYQAPSLPASFI